MTTMVMLSVIFVLLLSFFFVILNGLLRTCLLGCHATVSLDEHCVTSTCPPPFSRKNVQNVCNDLWGVFIWYAGSPLGCCAPKNLGVDNWLRRSWRVQKGKQEKFLPLQRNLLVWRLSWSGQLVRLANAFSESSWYLRFVVESVEKQITVGQF